MNTTTQPTPGHSEQDWPEDSTHENGNYQCRCIPCGEYFIGYKCRNVCRKCAMENKARWDALTPEQQVEETAKTAKEIAEYFARPTL